ncbi:MAG: hypothetical protein WC328_14005, partial [Kiritimatiellia bacterium]
HFLRSFLLEKPNKNGLFYFPDAVAHSIVTHCYERANEGRRTKTKTKTRQRTNTAQTSLPSVVAV